MSRPMALALVLLVLFLTSQSEWRASRSQGDAFPALVTKQQRVEMHRDGVKEKIIMDLMAETKRLEADNRQLEVERHRLQQRVHRLELKLASLLGPAGGVASAAAAAAASAEAVAAGASDSRGVDGSSMNIPGLEDVDQTSLPSSSFSDASQQSRFASTSSSSLPSSFVTDDDESSSLIMPSADARLEKRVQHSGNTIGRFASTTSEEEGRQRGRHFGTTRFEDMRGDEDDGDVRNEEDVALQLSRVFRGKQGSLGAAIHKVGPLRLGPPAPYGHEEGRLGKDGEGGGGLLSRLSEHQQHRTGEEERQPFHRRSHQAVVVGGG